MNTELIIEVTQVAIFGIDLAIIGSIGKTNALFVATLPYPPGVRQCRKAAEAARAFTVTIVTLVHSGVNLDLRFEVPLSEI
jgi:hypothetical protein